MKLSIDAGEEKQELLIADLSDLGFDAFEQENNRLVTYCAESKYKDIRGKIKALLESRGGECRLIDEEVIKERNWNREWERSIEARNIGPFRVRPTWVEEDAGERMELVIDPKMSFGTGYHETTHLMLELLPDTVETGDRVLDVGTGTGILGIAAVKLGASRVLGVDIDRRSVENAGENIRINEVADSMQVKEGSTDAVHGGVFDVILANINRNTILELGGDLTGLLEKGGRLVLSGIYRSDTEEILEDDHFRILERMEERNRGEWAAIVLENGERN